LEPEELASNIPHSSSSQPVGHNDTSSEAQAAPKEADHNVWDQSQGGSSRGSPEGSVKKSKGQKEGDGKGTSRGMLQESGLSKGLSESAASAKKKDVAKVQQP